MILIEILIVLNILLWPYLKIVTKKVLIALSRDL